MRINAIAAIVGFAAVFESFDRRISDDGASSSIKFRSGAPEISRESCCISETITTENEFMRHSAAPLQIRKPEISTAR